MGNNNFGELGRRWILANGYLSAYRFQCHRYLPGMITMYLDRNNTFFAMGANGFGQLGLGDTFSRTSPAFVTTGVMRLSGIPPPIFTRSKVVSLALSRSPEKVGAYKLMIRLESNGSIFHSVSQSGNILAVGADYSDPDGLSSAGAAYLYRLESNGSATYLSKVTAPDKWSYDWFGYSVSQSGNIIARWCFHSDPDGLFNAGAAYLYL